MEEAPSREQLKVLVSSINEQQDKMVRTLGMTRDLNRSFAAELEPLKTPIYFLWEFLGYGEFPNNRTQRYLLSSFRASPPDFLSECILQIKIGGMPIDDIDARCALIDFYSDLAKEYRIKLMKKNLVNTISLFLRDGWQKTNNRIKNINLGRCVKWWHLWPPVGVPPLLSAYEFFFYAALLALCLKLYNSFNDVPIKRIELSADRIDGYRYIDTLISDNYNYCLYFQSAEMTLQLPIILPDESDSSINNQEYPMYKAIYNTDSIPLRCMNSSDPFDSSKRRIINTTKMSRYWNIVFERAVRESGSVLPAPNEVVDKEYYSIRDIFLSVTSKSTKRNLDSCFCDFREQYPQYTNPLNTFHMNVKYSNSKESIKDDNKKWQHHGTYYRIDDEVKNIFLSDSLLITEKNMCNNPEAYFTSFDKKYLSNFRELRWNFDKKPNEAECALYMSKNALSSSWLTPYDISQCKYFITLSTSTIDSIRLNVNFKGAVNVWPSVVPDKQVGSSLIYEDQLKILQMRTDGLTVFVESKELANKQSIRLFVLSAIFSGLVIIIITFVIIALHRIYKKDKV